MLGSAWVSWLGAAANQGGPSVLDAMLMLEPVAMWILDETTGTIIADATGNGHDGTLSGSYALNQGSIVPNGQGSSIQINSGGGATVPDAAALQLTTQGTMVQWVANVQSGYWNPPMVKSNCTNNGYGMFLRDGEEARITTWNGAGQHTLISAVSMAGKKLIAGRWNNTDADIWMDDGVTDSTVGGFQAAAAGSQDLVMGVGCGVDMVAKLAFLAVYNVALSNSHLHGIWRAGQ